MVCASAESARPPRQQSRKRSVRPTAVLAAVPIATSDYINKITGPADPTDLLSCYVVNARSLKKPNALQLLQTEMFACMCDVAAVTKTWLSKTVDSTAIQIDGYTLYRNDRSRRRGGGIAVYVKERYNSSILSTANSHSGKLLGHELMFFFVVF